MARVKYTMENKKAALELLREENFKWGSVATQFGVSINTLKKWEKLYGHDISSMRITDDKVKQKIIDNRAEQHGEIREKAENVALICLNKILVELQAPKSALTVTQLTDVFSKVAPYILPKFEKKDPGKNKNLKDLTMNFINNLYQEQNNPNGHDTETTHTIEVDSQE